MPPPSTPPKSPVSNFRQKSNQLLAKQSTALPEAQRKDPKKKETQEGDRKEERHKQRSSSITKDSTDSRDSGLGTITNESASPNVSKSVKKSGDSFDEIGGVDNPAYDEDSLDDSSGVIQHPRQHKYPTAEEKIGLLTFDEMTTKYFQVQLEDEGLLVDKILPTISECCSKIMSEILGKKFDI